MPQSENRMIRAIAVALLLFVSLGPASANTGRVAVIGFVARQSEDIAQRPREAVKMAIDEANEQADKNSDAIHFVLSVQDDQGNPHLSIFIANYFAKLHISGVIGPWYSTTSMATAKIYSVAHIPQLNFTSSTSLFTKLGYKTTFRVIGGTDDLARSLAKVAVDTLHGQRIVVIGNDSSYSTALTAEIISEISKRSQNASQVLTVNAQTSDFNAALTSAVNKQADLIIFSAYVRQKEDFLKAAKRLGIKTTILFNDGAINLPLFDENNPNIYALEPGLLLEKCPRWKSFHQNFQRRFGHPPNALARNTYNATSMLIAAIRQSDSTDAAKVTDYLHQMHYKGIAGEIAFSPEGTLLNPTYTLYHTEGQKWQPVQFFAANMKAASGCAKD